MSTAVLGYSLCELHVHLWGLSQIGFSDNYHRDRRWRFRACQVEGNPSTQSLCPTFALSHSHTVTQPQCHTVTLSHSHTVTQSHCHVVTVTQPQSCKHTSHMQTSAHGLFTLAANTHHGDVLLDHIHSDMNISISKTIIISGCCLQYYKAVCVPI